MAESAAQSAGHTAFIVQLATKIPGKATCVEAWFRDAAAGSRVLVGLADGTLLVVAHSAGSAGSNSIGAGQGGASDSQHGPRLVHADSGTGSALGGGAWQLPSWNQRSWCKAFRT